MALISLRQIERITTKDIQGLVLNAFQVFTADEKQTSFNFTILDSGNVIQNSTMEINGIIYNELNEVNPLGSYARNGLNFVWLNTEQNGGFDLEEDDVVVLRLSYYSGEMPISYNAKNFVMGNFLERQTNVLGSPSVPNTYFEFYDLSDLYFKDFVGIMVNGLLYAFSNQVSYNPDTKELTLSGIQIRETDEVIIFANV